MFVKGQYIVEDQLKIREKRRTNKHGTEEQRKNRIHLLTERLDTNAVAYPRR